MHRKVLDWGTLSGVDSKSTLENMYKCIDFFEKASKSMDLVWRYFTLMSKRMGSSFKLFVDDVTDAVTTFREKAGYYAGQEPYLRSLAKNSLYEWCNMTQQLGLEVKGMLKRNKGNEAKKQKLEMLCEVVGKLTDTSQIVDDVSGNYFSQSKDARAWFSVYKKYHLQIKIDDILEEFSVLPDLSYKVVYYRHIDGLRWIDISKKIGYSVSQCHRFYNQITHYCSYR